MSLTKREKNRRTFATMIKERNLTQLETAALLHCSLDTIKAWLKPETSKSSLPVPAWVPELLYYKTSMDFNAVPINIRHVKRAAR